MYEPLSLRGRSFFISWDLTGGGGHLDTGGIYHILQEPPSPLPQPPPLKNERAIGLALFQEYDEEKYHPG